MDIIKKHRNLAAAALDKTHDLNNRGPRTFEARQRLSEWLDLGRAYSLKEISRDIKWLERIAK